MTPPRGTRHDGLHDTGENDAAPDGVTRDTVKSMLRQCKLDCIECGPARELREEFEAMKEKLTEKVDANTMATADLVATFRTYGKAMAGGMAMITLAVTLLGYMATRNKDAHIVTQAHASPVTTKATP